MAFYEFDCEDCGRSATAEGKPRRGNICFKCHVKTVDLGFKYGKDNFHGPTIKERQNKIVSDAKAVGIEAVPSRDYGF